MGRGSGVRQGESWAGAVCLVFVGVGSGGIMGSLGLELSAFCEGWGVGEGGEEENGDQEKSINLNLKGCG